MEKYYAQFVGAAALLVIVLSVQCKKKKNIMLLQTIANILYSIQYILLNAYSAAYLNIITVLRSYVYYEYDKKRKKILLIWPIIFSIFCIIFGYIFYEGPIVIIPVLITIAYTIGATYKNPNVFRIVFLVCAFIWIYYNYSVGAYVSIFGNVCEIISTYISLKRYKK